MSSPTLPTAATGPPDKSTSTDATADHVTSHVTPEAIEAFFLEYHKEKQHQEESELNQADELGDHGDEEEDPYNQSKELSPLSRAAVEVLQRCVHFMSAEPPQLRLTVLDALTHCLLALRDEQVRHSNDLCQGCGAQVCQRMLYPCVCIHAPLKDKY